jgi:SlyX protein
MTEEVRIAELETRFAYQDEAQRVLSDAVARQQQQIDQLERLCRQILDRLQAQNEALPKDLPVDELPPHY